MGWTRRWASHGPHRMHRTRFHVRRVSAHEAERWARKEAVSWWRRSKVWGVSEVVERLVVGEVSKVVPNHGEPSAASLAGREESSSGHHAAGHLLHTSLLAPLVLEPDLKEGNNLSAVDGIKLFYKESIFLQNCKKFCTLMSEPAQTCTSNAILKQKYAQKLLIELFQLKGKSRFSRFPPKKFYNINCWSEIFT